MPFEADPAVESEPSSIEMSPRLKGYAENLWRRFPEVFITLGASGTMDAKGQNQAVHHRIIETTSWKVIEIALPRWQRQSNGSDSLESEMQDGLSPEEARALRMKLYGERGMTDVDTDDDFNEHVHVEEDDPRVDPVHPAGDAGGFVPFPDYYPVEHHSSGGGVSFAHRYSDVSLDFDSCTSYPRRNSDGTDHRNSGVSCDYRSRGTGFDRAMERRNSGSSHGRESNMGLSPISSCSSSLASRRRMANLSPVITARADTRGRESVVRMAHLDRPARRQARQQPPDQVVAGEDSYLGLSPGSRIQIAAEQGRVPIGGFPESPGARIQRIGEIRRSSTGCVPSLLGPGEEADEEEDGDEEESPGSRMQRNARRQGA